MPIPPLTPPEIVCVAPESGLGFVAALRFAAIAGLFWSFLGPRAGIVPTKTAPTPPPDGCKKTTPRKIPPRSRNCGTNHHCPRASWP